MLRVPVKKYFAHFSPNCFLIAVFFEFSIAIKAIIRAKSLCYVFVVHLIITVCDYFRWSSNISPTMPCL